MPVRVSIDVIPFFRHDSFLFTKQDISIGVGDIVLSDVEEHFRSGNRDVVLSRTQTTHRPLRTSGVATCGSQ